MILGKKIVRGVVQAGKGSQVKLSTEFLLCIHVTKKEQLGKQGVTEAIRFFFLSMKKCQSNPISPLYVEGLYIFLMRDNLSKGAVAKKIIHDMDKHFGVFIIKWNDSLDHWMVDYDIICILKYYAG